MMSRARIYLSEGAKDELKGVDIVGVKVVRPSRVIGSPVETGEISFDNKVLDPMQVIVTCVVSDLRNNDGISSYSVIEKIEKMYQNRDYKFYSVCDGGKVYSPLILKDAPHNRSAEKYDWFQFDLTFVRPVLVSKKGGTPSNSENTNTRDCGYSNGTEM